MLRRPTLVTVAIALVVTLTACTESARIPDADPSSEVAPLLASDEEALAAATAAYEEYLAVLDSVLQAPTPIGDEFDGVAEGQAFDAASESVLEFVNEGFALSGPRKLGNAELQQASIGPREAEVTAYFCEDISAVLLLDANGESLTEVDRPNFTVFEVTVLFTGEEGVVIEREFWSNEPSC